MLHPPVGVQLAVFPPCPRKLGQSPLVGLATGAVIAGPGQAQRPNTLVLLIVCVQRTGGRAQPLGRECPGTGLVERARVGVSGSKQVCSSGRGQARSMCRVHGQQQTAQCLADGLL